jgi:PAS domain S-box-containing protein
MLKMGTTHRSDYELHSSDRLRTPTRSMMRLRGWRLGYLPRGMAILFACGLVAIALDASLFHFVTTSVADATRAAVKARGELDQVAVAHDALIDAEGAVRGLLLTGRAEELEPYSPARDRADGALRALLALSHDSADAQAQIDTFARLARERLDNLGRVVDAYRAGDRARALDILAAGRAGSDELRALAGARKAVLDQRIDALTADRERIVGSALAANAIAALTAIGILVFFAVITARHLSRRHRLEQKIQSSNLELEGLVAKRTQELEHTAASLRAELAHREQQEQMLRESEERFRLLIAGVKDYAIFRLDPQGYITSWNAGAERIKGYSADEIIGKHLSIFYTQEDRNAGAPHHALQTAMKEGKYEAEAVRVRKDGTRFIANVMLDALRDDRGRLVGFAKITRDVTERHQQQAALEEARLALAQSQKMEALGQLSGGIAHDFNNLLHVIKNASAILERRLDGSTPELREVLDMIDRSADRAAKLTQRLLAFSRRQPLQPQRIDPQKLVRDMEPLLKSALGASIELEFAGRKGVWPVSVDPSQLETAILNLAVNARDAMPNGGKLILETTNAYIDEEYVRAHEDAKRGEYALISITDTGTGMTPEVIAKAFEPFFTTKEIGQGTGLGLSQVYGFIKQSGGHVAIDSEVGNGTTIRLYLPRLSAAVPEVREEVHAVASAPVTETILLVEDEADVRSFTATALSELGYKVLTAADASSALAVLASSPQVDLLFTDVGLPNGVDGRQLVDEARKRWPALKVLFTTGYARSSIVHHGRLDPGVELIVKPFSEASLANRIRKILDGARPAASPERVAQGETRIAPQGQTREQRA